MGEPTPWSTCESVLSEALFLLREPQALALDKLLRRRDLEMLFNLTGELEAVQPSFGLSSPCR